MGRCKLQKLIVLIFSANFFIKTQYGAEKMVQWAVHSPYLCRTWFLSLTPMWSPEPARITEPEVSPYYC